MQILPFGHARLTAFFLVVALLGALAGIWAAHAGWESGRAAALAAALTALLGFAGVFFHRLRILPQKWREREDLLQAIHRESAKYRALLEGAADMVLVVDPASGATIECNVRAREALFGDDGLAPLGGLISGADEQALRTALAAAVGTPGEARALGEVHVRERGGRTLVCEARLAAVDLEDRRVVHVALRDRTREREIEHELALRERLSSLGLLVAGVAHEINNPLEGIGNHVKLLERDELEPAERRRHLELVRHGFGRIREIVRDLLRFARPAGARGPVDLAQVVERATRLLALGERFHEVEIRTQGLERAALTSGDAGRLEQVVFNLLINAATAMGGRGRIDVEARRVRDGRDWIELEVRDQGPGIPPADLARIFDPFFTTGGGTGLGLSIAFGIAQAHGGTLAARNAPGGGAAFTLRLADAAGGQA